LRTAPRETGLPGLCRSRLRRSASCVHPLYPLSTPCGNCEWIREVLCFAGDFAATELHDAHGEGGLAVVGQGEFGDPEIAAADDSPDSKPFLIRLTGSLILYVVPPAGLLA